MTAFSTVKPAFAAIWETEKLRVNASSSETESQFLQIMKAGE
tara:strand:- start:394 stop:519 length:126 start_codon:yes stop_codon:yes gene_type:complete